MNYGAQSTNNVSSNLQLKNLVQSPDSTRLLGPIWTASGLTLQAPCRLYVGNQWRSGYITATGSTFAIVATSTGSVRCEDRRNLQNSEAAADFKRQRSRFLRILQKRQEGGQSNG